MPLSPMKRILRSTTAKTKCRKALDRIVKLVSNELINQQTQDVQ